MSSPWIKWPLRILGVLLGLLLVLVLIVKVLEDRLAQRAIDLFNTSQQGELVLEDADINLLRHLPNLSLVLHDIAYYERPGAERPSGEQPILALQRLLVAVNPWKLISDQLSIQAIELQNGYAGLIIYPDSTTNLSRALTFAPKPAVEKKLDTVSRKPVQYSLDLKKLSIDSFRFTLDHQPADTYLAGELDQFTDRLYASRDSIFNELSFQLQLEALRTRNSTLVKAHSLRFEGEVHYDPKSRVAALPRADLTLDGASLHLSGTYDLLQNGYADLRFRAEQSDLALLGLVSNRVLNVDPKRFSGGGRMSLEGSLKGETLSDALPYVEARFEAREVRISEKESGKTLLESFNMQMAVTTGDSADLSQARLHMDTLDVRFADGYARGALRIENLKKPEIKLRLNTDNNLEVVQPLISEEVLQFIKGRLIADIDFHARIDPSTGKYHRDFGRSTIRWEDGSFLFTRQQLRADQFNAVLEVAGNLMKIERLRLVRDRSQFIFRGSVDNALPYLLKDGADLKGRLELSSPLVRLTDFSDSTLLLGIEPEFYELESQVTLFAPAGPYIRSGEPFSQSVLRLRKFKMASNVIADIKNITGDVRIDDYGIRLENWLGVLGESDLRLDASLTAPMKLWEPGIPKDSATFSYHIRSNAMRAADLFTLADSFRTSPQYRDESLLGLNLEGDILLTRPLQGSGYRYPDAALRLIDLDFRLKKFPVAFQNVQLGLQKRGRDALLNNFRLPVGKSVIEASGILENFFTPEGREVLDLKGSLRFEAPRLRFSDFLSQNFAQNFSPEFRALTTEMKVFIPAATRRKEKISGTYLELTNFETESNFLAPLSSIDGIVHLGPHTVKLEDWDGVIGRSDLAMDMIFGDLPPLWKKDAKFTGRLNITYDLRSKQVRARDIFTFRDQFLFADHYREETLRDFSLAGKVDLQRATSKNAPFAVVQVEELNWKLSLFPIAFRDFKMDFETRPGQTVLRNFQGRIGNSDLRMRGRTANLNALRSDTLQEVPRIDLEITSKRLDLDELILLNLPALEAASRRDSLAQLPEEADPQSEMSPEEQLERFNPFALRFPQGRLSLNVDQIIFKGATIPDLRGELLLDTLKTIELKELRIGIGGGAASMTGLIDATSPDSALITFSSHIDHADLSQVKMPITYGDTTFVISNHFTGILNADLQLEAMMKPDLTFDLSDGLGDLQLMLYDGQILDFPPMQMLSDVMGNKDLANIRFDTLANTIQVERGYLYIPKMDIGSTLGAVRITGFQYFDAEFEYMIQIPLGLCTEVGWNFLTGKKRKEDADEDEIERVGKGIKINIQILGNPADYAIKLGKGKKFRAIDRENKRAEREARKEAKRKEKEARKAGRGN